MIVKWPTERLHRINNWFLKDGRLEAWKIGMFFPPQTHVVDYISINLQSVLSLLFVINGIIAITLSNDALSLFSIFIIISKGCIIAKHDGHGTVAWLRSWRTV